MYLPILAPLLAFLGVYKSYHLQLPGACLILLMGSVFILQFNFEFLMIIHQKYTPENTRVSWIIAYCFPTLDPSIATLHFIQVCPGTPKTSWELSRNIYLLNNVWESPRSIQELPGTLRNSQVLSDTNQIFGLSYRALEQKCFSWCFVIWNYPAVLATRKDAPGWLDSSPPHTELRAEVVLFNVDRFVLLVGMSLDPQGN